MTMEVKLARERERRRMKLLVLVGKHKRLAKEAWSKLMALEAEMPRKRPSEFEPDYAADDPERTPGKRPSEFPRIPNGGYKDTNEQPQTT